MLLSHYLCAGNTTALVFLPNMVGDLLDRLHVPVGLSVAGVVEIVSVQFFFTAFEFLGLDMLLIGLMTTSFLVLVPLLLG